MPQIRNWDKMRAKQLPKQEDWNNEVGNKRSLPLPDMKDYSAKAKEASTRATELRKGGNRADGVLRKFD